MEDLINEIGIKMTFKTLRRDADEDLMSIYISQF